MKSQRVVFALAAVLFLWNLGGAHDLWAPDEPYFAEGAREMVVDGQWRVPHVNGVPSTDKPPLFFWTIALLSLPAGQVTPWTARLPSALAALGTILLVLRLGRRLGGERVAWLAGVTLCTTLMFWEKARWTQIEALLCFLIWAAVSAFEAWRAGDADGRRAGLLFWLAAALAVLAKGPVGLLLPLGIAVVTLASDRQLGRWRQFAPASGPLLFALVVGAWMTLATLGGEYSVWGALKEHFLDRAVHGLHHRQPPWYYLEVLPVHLLPWTGLLPGALLLAWRRRSPSDRFLLVAALYVVVFFSISTEKRHLYALPAVPAMALMIARLVDSFAAPAREDTSR
ncbi:MAG: ArnT family glycosyltransferase, partial [Thermoanaerobaculia bacterium]